MSEKEKGNSMMDMLKAGVHFGHKKSKKHPKMEEYIYTVRNDINIIDLSKTKVKLDESVKLVSEIVSKGGAILFIGTKRQAKGIIKEAAEKCGMPYVNERWLGGTFTNFEKISTGIERLKNILQQEEKGELDKKYTKKEAQEIRREIKRLEIKFGGIKNMRKLPDAVFVVDINEEETAIAESRAKSIPIIAIVDTNSDVSLVNHPIPANDDAMRSIELVTNEIADAVVEGKTKIK